MLVLCWDCLQEPPTGYNNGDVGSLDFIGFYCGHSQVLAAQNRSQPIVNKAHAQAIRAITIGSFHTTIEVPSQPLDGAWQSPATLVTASSGLRHTWEYAVMPSSGHAAALQLQRRLPPIPCTTRCENSPRYSL
jgi:hypothetical protein